MKNSLSYVINEYLKQYGRMITFDKLRRWEKVGLIKFDRAENNFRVINPDRLNEILNMINLLETGIEFDVIKNRDSIALSNHVSWLRRVVKDIKKPSNWS